MTFTDAVKSGFDHYAKFDGRATRPAYWYWVLFAVLAGIAANIVDAAIGTTALSVLVGLALFLPGLSVGIRRLHDTNRTGWWFLIALVPLIGFIVLIIFFVQDSDVGPNDYGPPMGSPAAPAAPPPATTA